MNNTQRKYYMARIDEILNSFRTKVDNMLIEDSYKRADIIENVFTYYKHNPDKAKNELYAVAMAAMKESITNGCIYCTISIVDPPYAAACTGRYNNENGDNTSTAVKFINEALIRDKARRDIIDSIIAKAKAEAQKLKDATMFASEEKALVKGLTDFAAKLEKLIPAGV